MSVSMKAPRRILQQRQPAEGFVVQLDLDARLRYLCRRLQDGSFLRNASLWLACCWAAPVTGAAVFPALLW